MEGETAMSAIQCHRLCSSLVACLLLGASLARAEPPQTPRQDATAARDRQAEQAQPNCIRDSGTRIKPRNGECVGIAGRSYSNDDLQRNGAINAGDALRRIDPMIGGASR